MRGIAKLAAVVALLATSPAIIPDALAGQCRDPWVTKAVTQVLGREPAGAGDSGECDFRRYGGGKWASYDDLLVKVRSALGKPAAPPQAPSQAAAKPAPSQTAPKPAPPAIPAPKAATPSAISTPKPAAPPVTAAASAPARPIAPIPVAVPVAKTAPAPQAKATAAPTPATAAVSKPAAAKPAATSRAETGQQIAKGSAAGATAAGAVAVAGAGLAAGASAKPATPATAPAIASAPKTVSKIELSGLRPDGSIEAGEVLAIRVTGAVNMNGPFIGSTPPTERLVLVEGSSGDREQSEDLPKKRSAAGGVSKTVGTVIATSYGVKVKPGTYRLAYIVSDQYRNTDRTYSTPFKVVGTAPLPSLQSAEAQRAGRAAAALGVFLTDFVQQGLGDAEVKKRLGGDVASQASQMAGVASFMLSDTRNPYSAASLLSDPQRLADLGLSRETADGVLDEFHAGIADLLEQQYVQLVDAVRAAAPDAVVDVTPFSMRSLALMNLDMDSVPDQLMRKIPLRQVKVQWNKVSNARRAVLTLQVSRALYASSEFFIEFDTRYGELMDNIQKAIDKVTGLGDILKNGPPKDETGAPKAGQGRALKALKVLEYIAIGAKVARYSLKVSHALTPSHISDFYVDIGNQNRPVGTAAVTIQPNQDTNFSVFIYPRSAGWKENISRETIIKQAVDSIWSVYAGARKLPDPDAGTRRIEAVNKIVQQIKQRFPAIAAFLGTEYVFSLIEPKKYRPFEINDSRLISIKSLSTDLIGFTPKPADAMDDKPFILRGLQATAAGKTAGYEFELNQYTVVEGLPTLREIVQSSGIPVKRTGVVMVGKPPDPAKSPCEYKAIDGRMVRVRGTLEQCGQGQG